MGYSLVSTIAKNGALTCRDLGRGCGNLKRIIHHFTERMLLYHPAGNFTIRSFLVREDVCRPSGNQATSTYLKRAFKGQEGHAPTVRRQQASVLSVNFIRSRRVIELTDSDC